MGLLTDPSSNSDGRSSIFSVLSQHYLKLSWILYVAGILFYLVLPHPEYSARTYFSENALLPGLVKGEFDEDRAANGFLTTLRDEASRYPTSVPFPWLTDQLEQLGLEVYLHNFTLRFPLGRRETFTGQNVYAILRAPRASSTEALVLSVPYRPPVSLEQKTDVSLALMLAAAKYFRRQNYWAKDIIFLITQHEQLGAMAWLEAYHQSDGGSGDGVLDSGNLEARAGSIQAAINLEIGSERVTHFNVRIEGLNGQLPNLDLVNLVNRLCAREGVHSLFQGVEDHARPDSWKGYVRSLETLTSMVLRQATGVPSGNHGLFHRFGIEALTIEGANHRSKRRRRPESDLYAMGRVVEGVFRSLNNLLERFHQSFFFYLLPSSNRYVSIGMYMPMFGLLGGSLVVAAIGIWFECLSDAVTSTTAAASNKNDKVEDKQGPQDDEAAISSVIPIVIPPLLLETLPPIVLCHLIGVALAYLPVPASLVVLWMPRRLGLVTKDNWKVVKCLCLIELSCLSACAALCNFGLALLVTAAVVPAALSARPWRSRGSVAVATFSAGLTFVSHPLLMLIAATTVDTFRNHAKQELLGTLALAVEATKRALVYAVGDGLIYGNAGFDTAAIAFLPCSTMLWFVNFAAAAAD